MSDGFQYGDLIFLGLIAAFIALRLRGMLGRNMGADPRDIWKQAVRDVPAEKPATPLDRAPRKPVEEEELVPEALQSNTPVAEGLKTIKAADASFSTTDFLSGARLAFEWVVGAFSSADKEKLRMLLSDERYQHFAADIDARAKDAEKHETTLLAILASDITEAQMQGTKAQITVQFTSEQVSVMRDKDKKVTGGDPSAVEKVIDVWTFERNAASRDPNWKIIAT